MDLFETLTIIHYALQLKNVIFKDLYQYHNMGPLRRWPMTNDNCWVDVFVQQLSSKV